MQTMLKHIFGSLSTVPACMPPFTGGQGVVIRRIGGPGHFRLRDKDKPFDPLLPTPPCYTQTARLYII